MSTVQLTYDADKHGLAVKEPGHQSVAMGCTYHAPDINDWSAGDLVATGVAGCMLFTMGAQASHDKLDIDGTVVDVAFAMTDKPFPHMESITLVFNMPHDYAPGEREKLEKAAGRWSYQRKFPAGDEHYRQISLRLRTGAPRVTTQGSDELAHPKAAGRQCLLGVKSRRWEDVE